MEDIIVPIVVIPAIFIGLPWIILHYISKWKTAATLTTADENLLDELHELARRLEERMMTVERIVQADNPNWRALAADPTSLQLEQDRARLVDEMRARRLDEARSNIPIGRNG